MISANLREGIEAAVARATGEAFRIRSVEAAPGGCMHRAFHVEGGSARYFVKSNAARFAEAFAAEVDGLEALIAAGARAPRPLAHGAAADGAFLVMEHVEIGGRDDWAAMGQALAALHRARGARYGWRRDNFIGTTPQANPSTGDWALFWRDARLLPQLALARRNGMRSRLIDQGARLAESLAGLLGNPAPEASLLHGDLWRGNAAFLADGSPALFDPAVYFGDREADLAMTELFGGFPPRFYSAYAEAWPLRAGYAARRDLYNLYHVLNHANLFGGGYAAQAETLIARLLAQTKG